jgi:GNAT superfamily N-acetyltransferase
MEHKSMFRVTTLTAEDFSFATSLTNTMGWDLVEEDVEFQLALEPEGCFKILEESKRIGLATTINFGRIGWIGNVVVSEMSRGRGAGSLLVKRAVQYLRDLKVATIGIYAYLNRVPFYERLNFEYDSDFLVLRGKAVPIPCSADEAQIMPIRDGELVDIVELDLHCSGAYRKKLFESLLLNQDNVGYVARQDKQITGFIIGKVYNDLADVGPLVCKRGYKNTALRLLSTIMTKLEGGQLSVCVPSSETFILDALTGVGFKEEFRVARMFYGSRRVNKCMYIAESLERG